MNKIDMRIKKLEDVIKPNMPHVIVVFGKEAAKKKLLEYQKAHPRSAEPFMVVVEFVEASSSSER
jgi:hypothetical protein